MDDRTGAKPVVEPTLVHRLEAAYQTALAALLAERTPEGHWVGELSTSALSTATAITALALVQRSCPRGSEDTGSSSLIPQAGLIAASGPRRGTRTSAPGRQEPTAEPDRLGALIAGGLEWLIANQNEDGGWGDTTKSLSNISTSMLVRATFELLGAGMREPANGDLRFPPEVDARLESLMDRNTEGQLSETENEELAHLAALSEDVAILRGKIERERTSLSRLEFYLDRHCGKSMPERAEAIRRRYGKDRTFAVPILTMCALAGLVPWTEVPPLPFELACFPQSWFRFFRLPVVSYALPALIAIGQAIHQHRPSWNPVTGLIRRLARAKSLRVLQSIQPSSGGFLEATPLTSFVTMSLASIGYADHAVARKGVEFIVSSVRPDGSWPIDTNLATWVTTLSINALAAAEDLLGHRRTSLRSWLLDQQFRVRHPYTGADPGGWGWTNLPGSVPDADDTPGVLLALAHFEVPAVIPAVTAGVDWLLGLQNSDGGWPTFCRGWGNLPFDRSGSDLTAHVIRALAASKVRTDIGFDPSVQPSWEAWAQKMRHATERGLKYLEKQQRPDGSWLPLWFGNQHAPDDENPTYGTARVLAAYRDLDLMDSEPARRGVAWLLAAQNADGGWGGAKAVVSSIEETALAVEVLLDFPDAAQASRERQRLEENAPDGAPRTPADTTPSAAVNRGLAWLVQQIEAGGLAQPTPIGFYFAKLWYFEKLYPIIFSVAALGRARRTRLASPAAPGKGRATHSDSAS